METDAAYPPSEAVVNSMVLLAASALSLGLVFTIYVAHCWLGIE